MTTDHYRTRRGVTRRKPLVNCKRQLLVPVPVVDVCPMWQDEGFPEVGILPSALFYYYPDGRWLLGRQTGRGAYVEWETLRPLDARHWLLDNGVELDELSENMRAALKWTSNHSEKRRTRSARIAAEDKAVLASWQRWKRISQVDILTQAVEALYAELGTVQEASVERPLFSAYRGAKIRSRALGALQKTGRRLKLSQPQVFHMALRRFDPREAVHG